MVTQTAHPYTCSEEKTTSSSMKINQEQESEAIASTGSP